MLKLISSFSAVGATALALSACGGGGGTPAPDDKAVDFLWTSLSQVIPAGKTSLSITPANCVDKNNGDTPITGVSLDIASNGDFSYKIDGVEQVLVPYSARTSGSLGIVGTPGSNDAYVNASAEAPETAQAQDTGRIGLASVSYHLEQTYIKIKRSSTNVNVGCTLNAALKHNGALEMDKLRASIIPKDGDVSMQSTSGNNMVLAYQPTGFSAAVLENGEYTLTAMPLTDSRIVKLTQNYSQTAQSLDGTTFTHWLDLNLSTEMKGTSYSDQFSIGYRYSDDGKQSLKMVGYKTQFVAQE